MSTFKQVSNTEKHEKSKETFKEAAKKKNPCYMEQAMSMKCLDDYYYDRNQCQSYFENYRNCKEFWSDVQFLEHIFGHRPLIKTLRSYKNRNEHNLLRFRDEAAEEEGDPAPPPSPRGKRDGQERVSASI